MNSNEPLSKNQGLKENAIKYENSLSLAIKYTWIVYIIAQIYKKIKIWKNEICNLIIGLVYQ